jgi:hypothetical protein
VDGALLAKLLLLRRETEEFSAARLTQTPNLRKIA